MKIGDKCSPMSPLHRAVFDLFTLIDQVEWGNILKLTLTARASANKLCLLCTKLKTGTLSMIAGAPC